MEEHLVSLVAILATSVVSGWLGVGRLGLKPRALAAALVGACRVVGLVLTFAAANVAVGAALVLGIRALTQGGPSLYFASEPLLVVSLVQALVLAHWAGWTRGG